MIELGLLFVLNRTRNIGIKELSTFSANRQIHQEESVSSDSLLSVRDFPSSEHTRRESTVHLLGDVRETSTCEILLFSLNLFTFNSHNSSKSSLRASLFTL